ncbi:MAG: EsaB/YukD family protein [Clostridiales bacterium]|nr:EsaB/YukD family protein [Clostridiales bacterium]
MTLVQEKMGFAGDFELPAQLPAHELCPMLLDTIRAMEVPGFHDWSRVRLAFNGARIEDGDCLADLGAWDGSILQMDK